MPSAGLRREARRRCRDCYPVATVSDMGVMIDAANIVLELVDIEASNGVIHVIDAVIAPMS